MFIVVIVESYPLAYQKKTFSNGVSINRDRLNLATALWITVRNRRHEDYNIKRVVEDTRVA